MQKPNLYPFESTFMAEMMKSLPHHRKYDDGSCQEALGTPAGRRLRTRAGTALVSGIRKALCPENAYILGNPMGRRHKPKHFLSFKAGLS